MQIIGSLFPGLVLLITPLLPVHLIKDQFTGVIFCCQLKFNLFHLILGCISDKATVIVFRHLILIAEGNANYLSSLSALKHTSVEVRSSGFVETSSGISDAEDSSFWYFHRRCCKKRFCKLNKHCLSEENTALKRILIQKIN